MDWEDIPINFTEKLKDHESEMFKEERKHLMDFIALDPGSARAQTTCNLNCFKCHPGFVVECWQHNKKLITELLDLGGKNEGTTERYKKQEDGREDRESG